MGLRDAAVRLLSRGTAEPLDEDEPVELTAVPQTDGPLVVAELRNHGIHATEADVFNAICIVSFHVRIMVRLGDLDAAHAVLLDRVSHEISCNLRITNATTLQGWPTAITLAAAVRARRPRACGKTGASA